MTIVSWPCSKFYRTLTLTLAKYKLLRNVRAFFVDDMVVTAGWILQRGKVNRGGTRLEWQCRQKTMKKARRGEQNAEVNAE